MAPDILDDGVVDFKARADLAFARLDEIDAGALVPHEIIGFQRLVQHQHVEGIGHGEQTAAELRSHVVAVPPGELHRHLNPAEVFGYVLDPYAHAPVGRPQPQQVFHRPGFKQQSHEEILSQRH